MKIGRILFVVLLLLCVAPWRIVFGQASLGYVKVASIPFATGSVTFTTTTALIPGAIYNLEVTEANAAGESGPSNVLSATEPTTGSHNSGSVTITAGTGGGTPTTLNFYLEQVTVPNSPGATGFSLN